MNTVIGGCLHLCNGFICSEGKHQNYPCPYGSNISKCPCSIEVTEKMAKQWDEEGRVTLRREDLKYNPLARNK